MTTDPQQKSAAALSSASSPASSLEPNTGPILTLDLIDGGQAQILTVQGEQVTVSAPRPYPPGASITGSDTVVGAEYRVKVRRCHRNDNQPEESPRFLVKGRLVNLSKSQREALDI